MKLKDKLNPISELNLIRITHQLSYDELAHEMRNYVGVTAPGLWKIIDRGQCPRSTLTAIELWLSKVGRRKFPLEGGKLEDAEFPD